MSLKLIGNVLFWNDIKIGLLDETAPSTQLEEFKLALAKQDLTIRADVKYLVNKETSFIKQKLKPLKKEIKKLNKYLKKV